MAESEATDREPQSTHPLSEPTPLSRGWVFSLGATLLYENEREIYWGRDAQGTKFAVVIPFDGEPATTANGSMISLRAETRAQVAAVHQAALAEGATDEGAVGPRGEGPFYGGYFRDLDGHKVCVFIA